MWYLLIFISAWIWNLFEMKNAPGSEDFKTKKKENQT